MNRKKLNKNTQWSTYLHHANIILDHDVLMHTPLSDSLASLVVTQSRMSATSWEVLDRTGFEYHWGQIQWQC